MPLEPTDPWSWLRLARSDLAYATQTPKWEEALALAGRVVAWVEALLSQGHG